VRFALGAVLDARGDFDAAFAEFAAGSALKRQSFEARGREESPAGLEAAHEAGARYVQSRFGEADLRRHHGGGERRAAPIFIVGFPRCGSSLVEQILASHPEVQAMGETGAFALTARAIGEDLPAQGDSVREAAAAYLQSLRNLGLRPGLRPVDKTLENYLFVGHIALAFPRAKIVHCLREPADSCVAAFCQLFASGAETLYDLGQIGREYARYRKVMDHWRRVAPARIAEVRYEALVAAPENEIRRLVTETCGLSWHAGCLEFHLTRRPIATASADQARQAIFATSVGRWRRYEAHLTPLFEALGPFAPARD
jgi:hypothetical protein